MCSPSPWTRRDGVLLEQSRPFPWSREGERYRGRDGSSPAALLLIWSFQQSTTSAMILMLRTALACIEYSV
ncbi:hypothetical protein BDV12DRAFT_159545 [Aspergillus spectabilis]